MDRITVMSWLEGLTDPDWSHFHSDSEVQNIASEALSLLKEDCHNCKLECLLQRYDQLKEKYDKLLKEQEALKEKLLRNIADNQLTVSPTGYETEEELTKRTGEWNGLQMAYEIVLNDGN